LNLKSKHKEIVNKNKIKVLKGWHDYTELTLSKFNDEIIGEEILDSDKFNSIKTFFRFFDNNDFFFNEAVFYELCNFWFDFFKKNKIEVIISPRPTYFETIPVAVAEKLFNIKVLTRATILRNYDQTVRCTIIDESNGSFIEFPYDSNFNLENVLYINNKRKFQFPRIYKLIFSNLSKFKFSSFFINISSLIYFFEFKNLLQKNSINNPDLKKKYIYYSMHFDPESATFPYEKVIANQLLNIRKISNAIPDDWLVYVKTHPVQINFRQNFSLWECYGNVLRYYKSPESIEYIVNLKNVKIIDKDFPQSKLIKNSIATSSICGSVFIEASNSKVPALVFGNKTLFKSLSNAYQANTINQLKFAIDEIVKKKKPIQNNHDEVLRGFSYVSNTDMTGIVKSIIKYLSS
jgi:hypothetical protein